MSARAIRTEKLSPIRELETLLDRIELSLQQVREATHAKPPEPAETENNERRSSRYFSFSLRRKSKEATAIADKAGASSSTDAAVAKEALATVGEGSDRAEAGRAEETAGLSEGGEKSETPQQPRFVEFPEPDAFVEDIRRMAELVVTGENYIAAQEKKKENEIKKSREKWNLDRDSFDDMSTDMSIGLEEEPGAVGSSTMSKFASDDNLNKSDDGSNAEPPPDYSELFDLFFERNALELVVNMLTGVSFDPLPIQTVDTTGEPTAEVSSEQRGSAAKGAWLPPIEVATQAIQSISILIQNVSRATSLYILLSNDHINTLIDLPMRRFEAAELQRREDVGDTSRQIFASPAMAELTTHFITLLKSLALRINTETLQFFLKYPKEHYNLEGAAGGTVPASSPHMSDEKSRRTRKFSEDDNSPVISEQPQSDDIKSNSNIDVEFPLYERSLEFCAAHQDSFVRVTAMNICLNVLRLTTVSPSDDSDGDPEDEPGVIGVANATTKASPGGVLHNANPLPFRERQTIALHACSPHRVERLVAPIFTKLSERWSGLDEAMRGLGVGMIDTRRLDKVSFAKEKVRRERLVRSFKDKAADLQDELLILEDVFKVGLTLLNEQLIEMMLATFVYPLLLQPLLNFCQRFDGTVDRLRSSVSADNPFGFGYEGDYSNASALLAPFSGPAKTSLFTLAAVFQSLTNPALLRLVYTVLLHPLSPDSTSSPTVRATLEVATLDRKGRDTIRVDPHVSQGGNHYPIANDRSTYAFGIGCPHRRKLSSSTSEVEDKEKKACVFVLAPALAEVLEFKGDDMGLIARARPNSYRQAVLQCLDVPSEMSDLQALAACTVDAAVSCFDSKFAADIMLGVDLRTYDDNIPADERNLDSEMAHMEDRGLGGSASHESRVSLENRKGAPVGRNLAVEVVSALCKATLFAIRRPDFDWKLSFDDLASHAILCIAKGHSGALVNAAKSMENRWSQAAVFLASQPLALHSPMGGSTIDIPGSPAANAPDYDEQMYGGLVDLMLYHADAGRTPVVESFMQLQSTTQQTEEEGHSVVIASVGGFDSMCKRVGEPLLADFEGDQQRSSPELRDARTSCQCFVKADALVSLLKDLSATGGQALLNVNLGGVAVSTDGSFVQTMDLTLSKQIFAPISRNFSSVLFAPEKDSMPEPATGSVVHLAGFPAIPCVCEAPASIASLFVDASSGVEAEGVTWQSLYLVFMNGILLFAQPIPGGGGGDGRVVCACHLERMEVVPEDITIDNGSPARRLFLSYTWFGVESPALFLFDDIPQRQEVGPFRRHQTFTSKLDVWFEHQRAAVAAYNVLSSQIFTAKASRGQRIQAYWSR